MNATPDQMCRTIAEQLDNLRRYNPVCQFTDAGHPEASMFDATPRGDYVRISDVVAVFAAAHACLQDARRLQHLLDTMPVRGVIDDWLDSDLFGDGEASPTLDQFRAAIDAHAVRLALHSVPR